MDEKKFWLVWNPTGFPPSYRHPDRKSAAREASRLAREKGGRFYVLESNGFAERADVREHSFDSLWLDGEPPF